MNTSDKLGVTSVEKPVQEPPKVGSLCMTAFTASVVRMIRRFTSPSSVSDLHMTSTKSKMFQMFVWSLSIDSGCAVARTAHTDTFGIVLDGGFDQRWPMPLVEVLVGDLLDLRWLVRQAHEGRQSLVALVSVFCPLAKRRRSDSRRGGRARLAGSVLARWSRRSS